MASRLHKGECVSRRPASAVVLLAASFSVAGGGCVYLPGINAQPKAMIQRESNGLYYVGNDVTFNASPSSDPDGDADLRALWRAIECNDVAATDCPEANQFASAEGAIEDRFTFRIPETHGAILIQLTVEDDRGASDTDRQIIDIDNRSPELGFQLQGYRPFNGDAFVLGSVIDILMVALELDGDPVELTWELFPPGESTAADFVVNPALDDAYRLTPDVEGLYTVRVTADDGAGGVSEDEVSLLVAEDVPPCLIPDRAAGGPYPVDRSAGPWSVGVIVRDDLDATDQQESEYFPVVGPSFSWQVASPDTGGALLPVEGLDDAAYQLDPSVFAPGDRISIRLEVADRVDRTLPCAAGDPSCSIGGDECYQRLTWEVEIR